MGKTFKDEREIVEPKRKTNEEEEEPQDYFELLEEEEEEDEEEFTFSKEDDIPIDDEVLEKYKVKE